MIRIIADDLEFEGRPFAVFRPGLSASFRDRVEDVLNGAQEGMITEAHHDRELKEQEDEFDKQLFELEQHVKSLQDETAKYLDELNTIDDIGSGARILELTKEVTQWQETARRYQAAFQQAASERDELKRRKRK